MGNVNRSEKKKELHLNAIKIHSLQTICEHSSKKQGATIIQKSNLLTFDSFLCFADIYLVYK